LGTFRVSKSKIFYDNRKETNPLIKSNIATNGILENFKLYWDFNELNNLVSDDLSSQWVWNSEVTRVNARGLELETKDALNRYTTAQYGFSKSSPVAILQNASYGEGFNEGFEDYRYNEMINKVQQAVCESRYVSFNETSNSAIVNMDSMQLNAHSGKSALRINGNSVATSQIILTENAATGFNLTNENDTTSYLDEVGINKDNLTIIQHGVTSSQTNSTSTTTQLLNTFNYGILQEPPAPTDPPQITPYYANGNMSYVNDLSFFIEIGQTTTYDIYTSLTTTAVHSSGPINFKLDFQILSLEGNLLATSQ